jgi:hypothetical protein
MLGAMSEVARHAQNDVDEVSEEVERHVPPLAQSAQRL